MISLIVIYRLPLHNLQGSVHNVNVGVLVQEFQDGRSRVHAEDWALLWGCMGHMPMKLIPVIEGVSVACRELCQTVETQWHTGQPCPCLQGTCHWVV